MCIQTGRDEYSRAVCVWFVRVIYDLRLADFVFFFVPFSVPFSSFFCSFFFLFLVCFLPFSVLFSSFFFPNDMEGTWHGRHVWESVPRLQADSKPTPSRLQADSKPTPSRLQAVWESVKTQPQNGGGSHFAFKSSLLARRLRRSLRIPQHTTQLNLLNAN